MLFVNKITSDGKSHPQMVLKIIKGEIPSTASFALAFQAENSKREKRIKFLIKVFIIFMVSFCQISLRVISKLGER